MIFEKIREIVVEQLDVNAEDVKLTTNLQDDLGVDSLDLFQVVMEIEEAFDIKLEEVEGIKTIEDAVKLVEQLTNN